MALSLGVSVGSKITVGLPAGMETVEVIDIRQGTQVLLKVRDAEFLITDEERVEIMPGVQVQCGVSDPHRGTRNSRLAFEAPKSISINRVRKERA